MQLQGMLVGEGNGFHLLLLKELADLGILQLGHLIVHPQQIAGAQYDHQQQQQHAQIGRSVLFGHRFRTSFDAHPGHS